MARKDEYDATAVAGGRVESVAETRAKVKESGPAVARDQLRSLIERIERLEEDKKSIGDDIKDVYAEAKGTGFDTKAIRKIIARRKKDAQELAEEDAVLDTYLAALGMQTRFDFDG